MRYLLVDRYLEFEHGVRARAVKCVTKGEPFLRDLGRFPSALVLEALLQTGGMLARSTTGFSRMSVLGKVDRAEFFEEARPGDRIELEVRVVQGRDEGALCEGVASVDGRPLARATFLIVFVPQDLEPSDPRIEELRARHMVAVGVPPARAETEAT